MMTLREFLISMNGDGLKVYDWEELEHQARFRLSGFLDDTLVVNKGEIEIKGSKWTAEEILRREG